MELTDLNQYAFHGIVVGLVIVSALLVYVFGFKPPVEPPFDKLTNPHDERKANGKKRKAKEKKPQSNGHVAGISDSKKDVKKDEEKSPNKEKKSEKKAALKENRDIKPVSTPIDTKKKSKGKENVEVKSKKAKAADEKPKDFDDGEWEQAPSRKDKKNKKSALEEILSPKKDKKKDQKKKKDESPDWKDEIEASAPVEPEAPTTEPQSTTQPEEEPLPQRNEVIVAESDNEQVEEQAKPKRSRKKKGTSGERATSEDGKASFPVAEPAKAPAAAATQPPTKPKKEPAPQPPATPPPATKTESPAPVQPPATVQPPESSVAFDELGDTWKEAKAPKKGGKKKSRKE